MKRIAALLMGVLMTLSGVGGSMVVFADDSDLPEALFTYDFTTEGAATAYGFGTDDVIDCEVAFDGAGFTTFRAAEGEKEPNDGETDLPDAYFKFGKDSQPPMFCTEAKYIIIKYRTTVACKGQIYTGRSDLSSWAQDGNELHWDWVADGEWNLALLDATAGAWAATAGEGQTFENFRFDPMDGAPEGSTIDVEFIKFFDDREKADEFRQISDPEKYTFYTATFYKEDGSVYKVVYFTALDTELEDAPKNPPRKKGHTGAWEEYTLGAGNIEIHPVYTPDAPDDDDDKPAETTTVAVEEETTTAVVEDTTAVEVVTTEAVVDTTTAAVDEETTAATAEDTTKTEPEAGCKAVIASASILGVVALAAGAVAFRKKD